MAQRRMEGNESMETLREHTPAHPSEPARDPSGQSVTVADMMQAREARAGMQRALLARREGACVVCLCMNIAGPVKTTPAIERAFSYAADAVRAVLAPYPVFFDQEIHEKTGPEALFCVQADAMELKRRFCGLEDGEALGRLLDLDVIRPDGEKVSRTELGLPARRCLLCGEPAPVCARSRAHSVQALFSRAHELIDRHFERAFVQKTGQNALRALLCEVAVSPKPGLVDRENTGAHQDMDMFTFIDSASALIPYFEACARTGLANRGGDPAACFDALRVPGLLAEAAMRRATGGVNTHKGAIFSLGIACASLGLGYGGAPLHAEAVLQRCGDMTRLRMQQEWGRMRSSQARTYGERLYRTQGVGGVRAEAAAGFPGVREASLPRLRACLKAGLCLNDACLCALVALMARTQDTNALHRGGIRGAQAVQEKARSLDEEISGALAAGRIREEMPRLAQFLRAWNDELCQARISPGGCADLLALTLLMHFSQEADPDSLENPKKDFTTKKRF